MSIANELENCPKQKLINLKDDYFTFSFDVDTLIISRFNNKHFNKFIGKFEINKEQAKYLKNILNSHIF